MNDKIKIGIRRTLRATSFALVLKGAVAGAVTLLAFAGVTVPYLSELFVGHAVEIDWGACGDGGGLSLGALAALRA